MHALPVAQEIIDVFTQPSHLVGGDTDRSMLENDILHAYAREVTQEIIKETGKEPAIRAEFFDSGVIMRLRYQSIAVDRQLISSNIVGKIVNAFADSDRLGFAYPHAAIQYQHAEKASLPPMFKAVDLPKEG